MYTHFYVTDPSAASPAKVQDLKASIVPAPGYQYFWARLNWTANSEPDLSGYEIFRKITDYEGGVIEDWSLIGFVATNSYTDQNLPFTLGGIYSIYYKIKIKAKDNTGKRSAYSNVAVIENVTIIPKTASPGQPKLVISAEFELAQNYPNPFNPTTTIQFALPEKSRVQITVYNIAGELITTLINGEYPAGYHRVIFDASGLASGIYLYRLKAGNPYPGKPGSGRIFVETRKMMVLK